MEISNKRVEDKVQLFASTEVVLGDLPSFRLFYKDILIKSQYELVNILGDKFSFYEKNTSTVNINQPKYQALILRPDVVDNTPYDYVYRKTILFGHGGDELVDYLKQHVFDELNENLVGELFNVRHTMYLFIDLISDVYIVSYYSDYQLARQERGRRISALNTEIAKEKIKNGVAFGQLSTNYQVTDIHDTQAI